MPPKAARKQLKVKPTNTTGGKEPSSSSQAKTAGGDEGAPSKATKKVVSSSSRGAGGNLDADDQQMYEGISDQAAIARIEEELRKLSAASASGLVGDDSLLDAPATFSEDDLEEIRRYEESLTSWRVTRTEQQPTVNETRLEEEEEGDDTAKEEAEEDGVGLARPESTHRRLLHEHSSRTTASTRPSSAGRLAASSTATGANNDDGILGTVPAVQGLPTATSNATTGSRPGSSAHRQPVSLVSQQKTSFSFKDLVRNVLPPEVANQGSTTVADALLEVTSARLDDLGMEETAPLECMTNLVHLHLQRNRIVDISGLEFMMSLNVLLLRGNQIKQLGEVLSLLPLKVLDLAENELEGPLDNNVVAFLPFETLEVLSLEDNPCTVKKSRAKDRNHPKTLVYRNAVLSKTPFLVSLDAVEVSTEERVLNNMDDPYDEEGEGDSNDDDGKDDGEDLDENAAEDDDDDDIARVVRKHKDPGMETSVKDSDFTLGANDEDIGDEREVVGKKVDVLEIGGDGDIAAEAEEESAVFPPQGGGTGRSRPDSASTSSKPMTPLLGNPGGQKKQQTQRILADGVVSRTQQMQEKLLQRYMVQFQQKQVATEKAENYQGEDERLLLNSQLKKTLSMEPTTSSSTTAGGDDENPPLDEEEEATGGQGGDLMSYNGAEENQEKLEEICGEQKSLRSELRQLGNHQSKVASSQLSQLFNNATQQMEQMREKAGERRRRRYNETSDVPSAAYQRALDKLKATAGTDDLSQFRKFKKEAVASEDQGKTQGTTTTTTTTTAGGQ